MKFIIARDLLDQTLNCVVRGLSTKTPMPVLMGIYLIADQNCLTFITTNREISIKMVISQSDKLRIVESGDCVVPGKYFADIVKKIDDGNLEFSTFEEKTIKIISKNSDFTLSAYDKYNFPQINFNIGEKIAEFSSKELKKIIRQTTFACATNESRIVLTSVNFLIKDTSLVVTSTDSFRLSRYEKKNMAATAAQLNISSRALEEFGKTINDNNDAVELFITSNYALFKVNNMCFVTRLIDGNYPDTNSLFARETKMSLKFDRQELIMAVDRASLFTSTESLNLVKMIAKESNDEIEIVSNSNEVGKVVITMKPLDFQNRQDFLSAFSTKNLLDALRAFDEETVTISFTGEIKPAIITSDENEELIEILLPVRTF